MGVLHPIEHILPADEPIDRNAASDEARAEFAKIPAKAAVYLLEDESGGPLLLATVGNLRAGLLRRLADVPAEAHSRRIPYGRICSQVRWRVVHSPFAANWYYTQAARMLFPQTYPALLPVRGSWWVAVERPGVSPFPRFRKTQQVADPALRYAGPVRDKHAAHRLIETLEDLFDLCRYHNILMQAPRAKACAYKEMGKCPAPCDGSIELSAYHAQIEHAFAFLVDPAMRQKFVDDTNTAMRAAAAKTQFETANRLKARLARAASLDTPTFAHLTALERFNHLILQPGQGKPYVETFLHQGGQITQLATLTKKTLDDDIAKLADFVAEVKGKEQPHSAGLFGAENIALVTHHLFRPSDPGIYMPLHAAGIPSIKAGASKILLRKSPPAPPVEQSTNNPADNRDAEGESADPPAENPPNGPDRPLTTGQSEAE